MKAAPYRPAWTSSCLLVQGASGLPKKQRKLIESPGLGLVKKDVSGVILLLFNSVESRMRRLKKNRLHIYLQFQSSSFSAFIFYYEDKQQREGGGELGD